MTTIGRRSLSLSALLITTILILLSRAHAGTQSTVTGELVETYCWAIHQVGGPAHAACGIECARRGLPVAILDPITKKALVLLAGKDKTSLPPALIEAMGHQVTIRGDIVNRSGIQFLTVQSWERAR